MRVHFQQRPWDLYVAIGYTLLFSTALLAVPVSNLGAIALIVFAPGYVIVAALFPRKNGLDWIERATVSAGLGIALVCLLGVLLNFTVWGIHLVTAVVAIAGFTVAASIVAYWRRIRLPINDRLSVTLELNAILGGSRSVIDKAVTLAVLASVVVAAIALSYLLLAPQPGTRFTEFYLLGPGGNASGYPTALNVSQLGTVILGITNHDAASVNYTIRIDLVGLRIVHNAASGFNETVEVNRTTWSTFDVTLADGRSWTQTYTFLINYTGLWEVQFLLFRDGNFPAPYREVHLLVRVG